MSEAVFGNRLDIHSGGIDLAFPHHDNEIAQAEAHSGLHEWVSSFWHAGHLHMEGLKMSKSLKNFITIKDALEKWSPKELRMFILLHSWSSPITFHEGSLREASVILNKFLVFRDTAHALIISADASKPLNWRQEEKDLEASLENTKETVYEAILDSFDTPRVVTLMSDLISKANIYIKDHEGMNRFVLSNVLSFIVKMMSIFGFDQDNSMALSLRGGIREGGDVTTKKNGIDTETQTGSNEEGLLQSLMTLLNEFRDEVRNSAAKKDTSNLFNQCDKVRNKLSEIGIVIEDRAIGKSSIIRFSSSK